MPVKVFPKVPDGTIGGIPFVPMPSDGSDESANADENNGSDETEGSADAGDSAASVSTRKRYPYRPIRPVFPVKPVFNTIKKDSTYKFTKYNANFIVTELNNTTADKYNTNAKAFTVVIDTNGNSRPNELGKDQFTFYLNNSCKIIPVEDGFTKQYVQNGLK